MPSDKACVAFIYGPKGSAIIDMEQQSRCRIVFDKEPIKVSNFHQMLFLLIDSCVLRIVYCGGDDCSVRI